MTTSRQDSYAYMHNTNVEYGRRIQESSLYRAEEGVLNTLLGKSLTRKRDVIQLISLGPIIHQKMDSEGKTVHPWPYASRLAVDVLLGLALVVARIS